MLTHVLSSRGKFNIQIKKTHMLEKTTGRLSKCGMRRHRAERGGPGQMERNVLQIGVAGYVMINGIRCGSMWVQVQAWPTSKRNSLGKKARPSRLIRLIRWRKPSIGRTREIDGTQSQQSNLINSRTKNKKKEHRTSE
jgi:hypothetical protein